MKIVHINWQLTFGGIETMLVNIANCQVAEGHEVTVLLINELYERTLVEKLDKRVKFMTMGRKRKSRSPMFLFKLNKTLMKIHPDVIHLHGSGLYGFLLRRRLSRVACATLHALPHGAVRRAGFASWAFLWNALKAGGNVCLIDVVPRVFAISQAVHDELLSRYGVESTVVSNGIVTKNFLERPSLPPKDKFHIVMVGRLEHDKKGQDLLIKAVAQMSDPNIMVDFIGYGQSMDYLQNLTQELELTKQVHFLGKQTQEHIATHLKDYDLFVQPSRYEGFGLTVAEAMAAQVPILVSAGQGPAEVCCGETYGWVFENGNVGDLVEKISYIQQNYLLALEKAKRAKDYVHQTYDVAETARRYVVGYRKPLTVRNKNN